MKALYFITASIIFLAYPAWSDSIYILGTYANPDGRENFFDRNRDTTTFDSQNLDAVGVTAGYDRFVAGDYLRIGGSVSYYNDDGTAIDLAFFHADGSPVRKVFRMKLIPVEVGATFVPPFKEAPLNVYIGGGVGYYFWEYEESGQFVVNRDSDPTIVNGRAFSDGTEFGFMLHGGIFFPVGKPVAVQVQIKHNWVEADPGEDFDQAFRRIDLSFITYAAGIVFTF